MQKITEFLMDQLQTNEEIIDHGAFLDLALATLQKMVRENYSKEREYNDNIG